MAKSITSANSQLAISVNGLFSAAIPIQGYAADASVVEEAHSSAEVVMGVDGYMSAGFTPKERKFKITLSPDSPSKPFFDQWNAANEAAREVMFANAVLSIPSTGETFTMSRGVLTSYHSVPPGKKVLGPIEYEITFNSISKGSQ